MFPIPGTGPVLSLKKRPSRSAQQQDVYKFCHRRFVFWQEQSILYVRHLDRPGWLRLSRTGHLGLARKELVITSLEEAKSELALQQLSPAWQKRRPSAERNGRLCTLVGNRTARLTQLDLQSGSKSCPQSFALRVRLCSHAPPQVSDGRSRQAEYCERS